MASVTETTTSNKNEMFIRRLIGLGLSTLGLVSVIDDARAFRSSLKDWIDSWKHTVERISDLLFGWVDFAGLDISDLEAHGLTIIGVYAGSYVRANTKLVKEKFDGRGDLGDSITGTFVAVSVFVFGPAFVIFLLLPDPSGLIFGTLLPISITALTLHSSNGEVDNPLDVRVDFESLRRELVVVTGFALAIVVLDVILLQL